jgi:hypothetical protein
MVLFEVKKYLKYFPSTATDKGSFGSGSLDLGDGGPLDLGGGA